jgi:hypothetical protein
MKRFILIALLALATAATASAQWFDFSSNARLEFGLNFGKSANTTQYGRLGFGAYLNAWGVYVDFLEASPQHRYDNKIKDTQYEDDMSWGINAGYQIPVLSWLKIMPVFGYLQTNEGITDASTINIQTGEHTSSIYHDYDVTPGSRRHYFNYGGGISLQPFKYVSFNFVYTRYSFYGGIGFNLMALAD